MLHTNLSDTENIGEFLSFSGTAVGFGSPQYQSLEKQY
jgi:hypothetical protein